MVFLKKLKKQTLTFVLDIVVWARKLLLVHKSLVIGKSVDVQFFSLGTFGNTKAMSAHKKLAKVTKFSIITKKNLKKKLKIFLL
jgi:hypothetical protein